MTERLGVDIGGVILGRANDGTDTSFFGDNYLATAAVPDAIDVLSEINTRGRFTDNVHLVSKCGLRIQQRTTEWLAHQEFHSRTRIPLEKVHFTPTRIGKAAIAESLGLTHFVDDRAEVLGYLIGSVENLYLLNSDPTELKEHRHVRDHITIVNSWRHIADLLG